MTKVVIYVPGLGNGLMDVSMAGYARRFARSLDRNDKDKKFRYQVTLEKVQFEDNPDEDYNMAIISRRNPDEVKEPEEVYRIYEFGYQEQFTKEFNEKNIFIKSLKITWAVLRMIPLLFYSIVAKGLNRKQRFQTVYFFLIIIVISLFVFFLVPSLLTLLLDNISSFKDMFMKNFGHVTSGDGFIAHAINRMIPFLKVFKDFSHWSVVIASSVAMLKPDFQRQLTSATSEYLCAHYYLKYGEGKSTVTGNLANLVEKVAEREKNYEGIELHAYSFGTIVAIDTVFPRNPLQLDECVRREVRQMVTVGSPFDFIRVYYPRYFRNRHKNASGLQKWYNVNCELDVMSSNFRNDSKPLNGEASVTPGGMTPVNITYEVTDPRNVGLFDYLFLLNFKTHRMYWTSDHDGISFFTNYLNKVEEEDKKEE